MFRNKEKGLQSLFQTLHMHGRHATTPVLQPQTPLDTATNVLNDAAMLARDVAEALEGVPYVKSITGIFLKIVKVREELKANKERCEEIIQTVCQHSYKLFRSLELVANSSEPSDLASLKADLEEYRQLLESALQALAPFTDDSLAAKSNRFVSRAKNASDLAKIERRLVGFQQGFNLARLTAIEVKVSDFAFKAKRPESQIALIPQALPPPPPLLVGRDVTIEKIVNNVIHSDCHRIAILGQGGIGKTTVASQVLHHPAMQQSHQTRFFVSCESSSTAEHLLTSFADMLAIPEESRKTNLESLVVHKLASLPPSTLLCLDNLETMWDDPANRPPVDSLLGKLSSLGDSLTLVITMRGTQCPACSTIHWEMVLLDGLSSACSVEVYESITRKSADEDARALLEVLDGLPLAITLFARLVAEGDKPSDLLHQWRAQGTTMLGNGGVDRLSTLNYSIEHSVRSPRMDDSARRVLGLLSCLPAGLKDTPETLEWIQKCLPDPVYDALRTLRRVGLIYQRDDARFGHQRWQMLSPIKEYCHQFHRPNEEDYCKLINLWSSFLTSHDVFSDHPARALIEPELPNFHALLFQACNLQFISEEILDAIFDYIDWAEWTGRYDVDLAFKALQVIQNQTAAARLYCCIGDKALVFSHLDEGEKYLQRAKDLFIEIDDRWEQANCLVAIGGLQMQRDQLEDAEKSLRRAQDLYSETDDRLGQGNTLKSIGNLQIRRDQLDDAEKSLLRALDLYVEIDNRLGQANSLKSMGNLSSLRERLDRAEEFLCRAQALYVEMDDRLGQANSLKSIGDLQIRRNQLDVAEKSLNSALDLYAQMDHRWGQASSLKAIGDLQMQRDQLDHAEESLRRSLDIWAELDNRLGQANSLESIGNLQMRRDQLDDAEKTFFRALDLSIVIENRRGQASSLKSIGDLQKRRDRLDDSEKSLFRALDICVEMGYRSGQATALESIGDLMMRRAQLGDSENALRRALDLFVEIHSQLGQANCHWRIGNLLIQQGEHHKAEENVATALDLHRTASDRWGEADDLILLGRILVKLGKLKNAEERIMQGLHLVQGIELTDTQGQGHRGLGELAQARGEYPQAIKELKTAIEIHRAGHHLYEMRLDIRGLVDLLRDNGKIEEADQREAELAALTPKDKT